MFRHWTQLLLLLVAPIVISLAVALALPNTYQAKATLWALRLYQTDTSQAGVAAVSAASSGQPTPAGTQAAVLTELLQTHVFVASVAEAAGIGSASGSQAPGTPTPPSDAVLSALAHQVQVAAKGDHLVAITYSSDDPRMAQQVIAAVIQQYAIFMGSQQTGSQGTASTAFYNILDAPAVPSKPESRGTRLLLAGGAGLGLSILAGMLYVVMLVRRDHIVYDPRDVHDATRLPVIAQLPTISRAAVDLSWDSVTVSSSASVAGGLDGDAAIR
jgi:uncharacterized protein involved in exopolysaccharide biosynthesis